ncbi:N-glycosylase [archaeon]|nr:N-glycosylase [archaeon]|tara:strand:+ start:1656 stop:2249 length:594 start_codon:yes stop_codon:yes gene_type:complete
MKNLLRSIENLKKNKISNLINSRIKEFKTKNSDNELFKELCFCILTANFNAEKTIKIQEEINDDFLTLPESELSNKLKEFGHRYPNARTKYIIEARKYKDSLKNKSRGWLIKNIKGLGYKEASHFLRNIGHNDYAIIDFHIIDVLIKNNLIEKPKTLTKTKYLEIESLLKEISEKSNLSLAELDLYLWYTETGKILK